MRISEIEAKSILTPSRLPNIDYVINPYVGCAFGCAYCYASFMGRLVGEKVESWGDYVYVKRNAVELLGHDLDRLERRSRFGHVLISSVTDPYQGAEVKYRLTRQLLIGLADRHYPDKVSILTKSPLVTRDIDVLRRLPSVEVGFTVTTDDDELGKWLEVRAPRASGRIAALRRLHESGIATFAFLGPLLPHFAASPELLDRLFTRLAWCGVSEVLIEQINLSPRIRRRMKPVVGAQPREVQEFYAGAIDPDRRDELGAIALALLERHGLQLRLQGILDHTAPAGFSVTEAG